MARSVVAHVGELLRWSAELVGSGSLEMSHWTRMGIAAPADDSLDWVSEARATAMETFNAADTQGLRPTLDDDLVIEGIDEHLSILPWTAITDPAVGQLRGTGETIALEAIDGPRWRIRFVPGGFAWDRSPAPTSTTVNGTLFDVYMHTHGRPNGCTISGDFDLHARSLGSLSL